MPETFEQILEEVKQNSSTLTICDLEDHNIDDNKAKQLAEVLQNSTNIKEMNLAHNQIGDEGVKALAKVLKHNDHITSIILWDNKISDKGAREIAEVLKKNKSITSIELGANNKITAEGIKIFEDVFKDNKNLGRLDIASESIKNLCNTNKNEAVEILHDLEEWYEEQNGHYPEEDYIQWYYKLSPRFTLVRELQTIHGGIYYHKLPLQEIYEDACEGYRKQKGKIISSYGFTIEMRDAINNILFSHSLSEFNIADAVTPMGNIIQEIAEERNNNINALKPDFLWMNELKTLYTEYAEEQELYKKEGEIKLNSLEKAVKIKGVGALPLFVKYFRSTSVDARKALVSMLASVDRKYTTMLHKLEFLVPEIEKDAISYIEIVEKQVDVRRKEITARSGKIFTGKDVITKVSKMQVR